MKDVFLTTIRKPSEVLVNKFFFVSVSVSFFFFPCSKGQAVRAYLPRYYLNDLCLNLSKIDQISKFWCINFYFRVNGKPDKLITPNTKANGSIPKLRTPNIMPMTPKVWANTTKFANWVSIYGRLNLVPFSTMFWLLMMSPRLRRLVMKLGEPPRTLKRPWRTRKMKKRRQRQRLR